KSNECSLSLCLRVSASNRMPLEHEPESELCVPRLTEAEAGGGTAVARCRDLAEAARRKGRVRIRVIRSIEQIEDLHAELGPDPLGNRRFLEDRKIHRAESGPVDRVPAEIAECAV